MSSSTFFDPIFHEDQRSEGFATSDVDDANVRFLAHQLAHDQCAVLHILSEFVDPRFRDEFVSDMTELLHDEQASGTPAEQIGRLLLLETKEATDVGNLGLIERWCADVHAPKKSSQKPRKIEKKRGRPGVTDVLQIRKYPNKRYYDATRSRHVRLLDIRKAVQAGCFVCIRDSRTDEDITNQVLAQIILNDDSAKLSLVPSEALHHLIRSDATSCQTTVRNVASEELAAIAKKSAFGKSAARLGFDAPKPMASRDLLIGRLVRQRDQGSAAVCQERDAR